MAETDEVVKKFMYVNRKAPYGSIYAQESLEVVLVAAAYEQDVTLVFLDDGVFQLVKGQDTNAVAMKDFSPAFKALDGYDVEKLYVERESMEKRGLTKDDFLVDVKVLTTAEVADIMAEQDVILSF